jgi:hypothetical protein
MSGLGQYFKVSPAWRGLIVSGLAENTNSIFCDGYDQPEAAHGCPVLLDAGTINREANVRNR